MKKAFAIIASGILLVSSAFAQDGQPQSVESAPVRWGITTLSTNFMREKPGYDEENGDQAMMGTVVQILGEESYWVQLRTCEPYVAWVNSMAVKEVSEAEKDEYVAAPKFICTAEYTHIYSEPNVKSLRVSDFVMGDLVCKTGKAKGKWVCVLLPSGKEGWVLKSEVMDFGKWYDSRRWSGESVVALAKLFLGVPYMWGGTSIKHVDCSGLTRTVYHLHGILLPRNASQQAKVGVEIPSLEEALPGDLIFFGRSADGDRPERVTHTSIYIGGGRIIHSSQVVRINSLIKGEPDYYGGNRLHIRRILTHVDDGTGVTSMAASPYYFKQN